jgi:hypothetical protein
MTWLIVFGVLLLIAVLRRSTVHHGPTSLTAFASMTGPDGPPSIVCYGELDDEPRETVTKEESEVG